MPDATFHKKVWFGVRDQNTDSIYFERFDEAFNKSELRLILGDDLNAGPNDNRHDTFKIGTVVNGKFVSVFSVDSRGVVGR